MDRRDLTFPCFFDQKCFFDRIDAKAEKTWSLVKRYKTMANGMLQQAKLDANRYATKKTISQGLLDIALLTANASQLKYVLEVRYFIHPRFSIHKG